MATKKQRRRREKDRRHEYEFVYYDEEGNEVEVETPEKPSRAAPERKKPAAAAARNGRARPVRAPKPPTWRSVGRIGVIMFALLFLFSSLVIRAPLHGLLGASSVATATQRTEAGVARAFRTTAVRSGKLSNLVAYVDKTSKASKLTLGLYANEGNAPGTLLAKVSAKPSAGKWNSLGVPSKTAPEVVKGKRYWLALLGSGGSLVGRNTGLPTQARESSVTTLAPRWGGGTALTAGLPSLYAATKGSVGLAQRLLLPLLYTLILIPSIYLMQRMSYRSYLKRTGQLPQRQRQASRRKR
jgi:hypothetical protein